MASSTTIKLPTYSCALVVSVVDNVKEEANRIYKKHKIAEMLDTEAEGALLPISIKKYYLLFQKEFLSYNTIAHEVFHAAIRVTEDRDVKDEEAQAWLTGHVTAEIYKFLEKKDLQIKHG